MRRVLPSAMLFLVMVLFMAGVAAAIDLTSPAFKANERIPAKFSCEGQNINPALNFSNVPAGTKQLVLTMHDPDVPKNLIPSGNFDHWFVWDLPANSKGIAEGMGSMMGMNGTGKPGYIGPCPPDREHRYFFRLYALDTTLQGKTFKDRATLEDAIKGHVLAQSELIGRYEKGKKGP
jgi:Raf kinase inhibitor-like YbhB/YbcL family protein